MLLALIILLPFMGVLLPVLTRHRGRTACAWATAAAPALALLLLLSQTPAIFAGEVFRIAMPWFPSLGLELAFHQWGQSH